MSHEVTLPERVLFDVLKLGLDTINADLDTAAPNESELDRILAYLDTTERAKAREIWALNPPTLVMGYARDEHPFPIYALTLGSDDDLQQYIGDSEHALAVLDADFLGIAQNEYAARETGRFNVACYHEHPDLCAWMYRVLRQIVRVGTRRLIAYGLTEPRLTGQELAPWERPSGNLLFVRRLMISVEYNETWLSTGPLWAALNGTENIGSEVFVNVSVGG